MKRLSALLLALCMLLCACGGETPQTTQNTTLGGSESTTGTSDTTKEEPTPPPVLYRHPLTGEPLDAAWSGRPTAVVINNLKDALPHHGVSQADFLYEIETEGGITRCLAVFSDISAVGQVGPIRSARTFFNNIAVSYDAPIVHCGGSVRGRNAGYGDSSDKIKDWAHLDATYYETQYFFRDMDRYNYQGYNWEHTLFSTGEKLLKGLQKRSIGEPTAKSTDFGLQFSDAVELTGEKAESIKVTFLGDKTTSFTYDAANSLYKTAQYGADYIDANTNQIVTFKNVMVLYTSQWKRHDGEYSRSYYDLTGEGDGVLAINGKLVPIKWSRADLRENFKYTFTDGTPITLGVGSTYVAVASVKSTPVSYS